MVTNTDFLAMFESVMAKIKSEYLCYNFFTERDFEWTVQKYLWDVIHKNNLSYEVFHNHPIEQRAFADLVIVRTGTSYRDITLGKEKAEFIAEFKFEPSRRRTDFCEGKLKEPVVFWNEVNRDIDRILRFVETKKTRSAVAVLIDEFGRFRDREINNRSTWIDWGNCGSDKHNISILLTSLRAE